ncbi:UDP-glycosyltransferase UGT5-like isoform X1 [Diorhabda carinulata]|uniref:UDP-glycosyltransferase UGT5-like isoform X1 n=1 Tax=Diorhabda carinulata TaxID=1163345 RepID=UPI0025A0F2E6|nr:UDP-glycosyltransferase UGT5-like isoform X1 [Diorhabda carinulata]
MFMELLVPILVSIITVSDASNILVVIPTPAYSHQISLRPIWKQLLATGHQITLATTNPIQDPSLDNLKEIDMHETYSLMSSFYSQLPKVNKFKSISLAHETLDSILDYQLSKYLLPSIRNETIYDLVIVESLLPEYLTFGDYFQCPTIMIASFEVTNMVYNYVGNPTNPAVYPDMLLPIVAGKLNFKERLVSFLYDHLFHLYKIFISYPTRRKILEKYFGQSVRYIEDLYYDIDLLMLNVNPIINDIKPVGPATINFGGAIHVLPAKPLPKDLQEYLDSATEGCIYFSLGTNSKSIHLEQKKIEIIKEALGELPYKILWKFESEEVTNLPDNIKLISWVPQQDILRHPNVKLFITQGGIQSLEEAIVNHVPMAMLPVFGDQEANAKRMELKGIAKIIPHQPLPDKDEFKRIIFELINDSKYKENIIKIANLLLDQPMGGVEKAVWWIEYVIRHKGAKHLRNPALDVPFYQYYSLDVIAALLLITYILFKLVLIVATIMLQIGRTLLSVIKIKNQKKKTN